MPTIRVWNGPRVTAVLTVNPDGMTVMGATGGAANSVHVDIELDPWANLIVDHRASHPVPVSIREELGNADD